MAGSRNDGRTRAIARAIAILTTASLAVFGLGAVPALGATEAHCADADLEVPSEYGTIQAAIAAASPGGTVCVAAGTYAESGLVISQALTLRGAGIGATIVDASADTAAGNILAVHDVTAGSVLIEGFSIETGAATLVGSNGIDVSSISDGVTVTIHANAVRGRQGVTDLTPDNFPVYAHNTSGGSTAELVLTDNVLYGGGDNTLLLEGWRGPILVSGNTIHRPAQDTSTTSVIFTMNYGNVDATGAEVFEGNTIVMSGGSTRADVITVASGFDSFAGDGLTHLGTGGFDSVIFRDNTITGMPSTSRGVILWDQSIAADSAIDALISGNTFLGSSANFGVRVTGPDVTAAIRNNDFAGVATGVRSFAWFSIPAPDGAALEVHDNALTPTVGVNWTGGVGTLDAAGNWWGSADGPDGTRTVGAVTTSPWIATSTADPAKAGDPGFWPIDVDYGFAATSLTGGSDPSPVPFSLPDTDTVITVDLPTLAAGGDLTVEVTSEAGGTTPVGFTFGEGSMFFDIAFTGTLDGSVEICIDGTFPDGTRLFHHVGGVWTDVTTSSTTSKVCGLVTSFSPFALTVPLGGPVPTITFTGTTYTTVATVTMSAVLDPDTCTGTIAFDLTPDPTGGDPAPQTVVSGAASVAVTLPASGIYEVVSTYTSDGACDDTGVHDSSVLVYVAPGGTANGGGWYKDGDVTPPRANFGFVIQKTYTGTGRNKTFSGYRGQFLWINNEAWRLKADLTGGTGVYGTIPCPVGVGAATSGAVCAAFHGSGMLQSWDPDLSGPGLGGWVDEETVTFTVTVYDGGQVKVCKGKKVCTITDVADWFGIEIDGWPSSLVPETMPVMLVQPNGKGSIKATA